MCNVYGLSYCVAGTTNLTPMESNDSFSKCESSLTFVKGHDVSHSRHLEALLEGTKIISSLPRNTITYNDIKAYVHQVSVKTYLGSWVDI